MSSLGKVGVLKNYVQIASVDSDREEWQPKGVIVTLFPEGWNDGSHFYHIHANTLGFAFMPMVFVDRLLVHHTKSIDPQPPKGVTP
jgi:hypothetical protein